MTVRIDKAGRVVLPKPNSPEEGREESLVRPLARRTSLVEEAGVLVHVGEPEAGFDWTRAVEDSREERFRDLAVL